MSAKILQFAPRQTESDDYNPDCSHGWDGCRCDANACDCDVCGDVHNGYFNPDVCGACEQWYDDICDRSNT